MKHPNAYGTYVLTRRIARRIRLEWDRVEQPAWPERFRERRRSDVPSATDEGPSRMPGRTERRPFAA